MHIAEECIDMMREPTLNTTSKEKERDGEPGEETRPDLKLRP